MVAFDQGRSSSLPSTAPLQYLLVRSLGFSERQMAMDVWMQCAGGEHLDEGAHASAALKVIPSMDGELPDRWRVLR